MSSTTLKKQYDEKIVPALTKEFNYTTPMQVPRLTKIVINEGLGEATQDKKIIETAINELTAITGQKAVPTLSRKDISNFKVRKKMPIGARVTLRRERMYEFLERLVRVALPRIRDFKGIEGKLDGRGNYTLGISEQIIFPEINIDTINTQADGHEHHFRNDGQHRRRRLCIAQTVRPSLQEQVRNSVTTGFPARGGRGWKIKHVFPRSL